MGRRDPTLDLELEARDPEYELHDLDPVNDRAARLGLEAASR